MPLGADGGLAHGSCVLDVMAPLMSRVRVHLDVDDGQPVHASYLETPEAVNTGAGVGVASTVGLMENDLDAHRRSMTQFVIAWQVLRIRCIPWLSSETVSAPTPLPYA